MTKTYDIGELVVIELPGKIIDRLKVTSGYKTGINKTGKITNYKIDLGYCVIDVTPKQIIRRMRKKYRV